VSEGKDPDKLPTPTVDKAKMNYTKMMMEKSKAVKPIRQFAVPKPKS